MTNEDSVAIEGGPEKEELQQVSLHFREFEGWAVLRHRFHNGKFNGVVAVAVLGFLFPEGSLRPAGIVTVFGPEPATQPLLGPYGEVTDSGIVFSGVDEYCNWYSANHQ